MRAITVKRYNNFGDKDNSHAVGEFDSEENWSSYTERLTEYFEANNIEQEKDRAALLSVCGAETYQLIRNLLAAAKQSSKTYKQLVTFAQDHSTPSHLLLYRGSPSTRAISRKESSLLITMQN